MKQNWTYKKLGEVCEIYQPKTISMEMLVPDGQYLVYGANGVIGRYDQYNHEESEVLLTCRGATCGSINVSEPYSWINGNAMVIHPIDDSMFYSRSLLVYLMRSIDYSMVITGAAQPQITRQKLSQVKIAIPPITEQEKILSELDLLQSIIDKQQAQLKELDTLAQSIFYDMFGDPVENEKGWEVKRLGECCTNVSYGTSAPSSSQGRFIYLRMNNITYGGELDLTDVKYIDLEPNDFEKYSVKEGDILFNRTNSAELVGKTTWFHNYEPMVIAGYIIRVRLSETLLPVYVSAYMNTKEMKLILKAMGKGAVNQANINSKELQSIRIPVPPLSLQQEFAEKIEKIECQKTAISQSIAETQKLFDYTMDKYFG